MPLNLDYFYGNEAEQYSFYRIPKTLFTDKRYKSVSVEAKVLYGLLLDRMSLSTRNGWFDSDRKVYVYFTLEDALSLLGCGKDKAVKLFKELDIVSGIGLIERKKQGQGRPTRIYVKNFIIPDEPKQPPAPEPPSKPGPPPQTEPPTTPESPPVPEPPPVAEAQTSENQKSALPDREGMQTSEKPKSAQRKNRSQDCGKSDPRPCLKNLKR